MKICLALLAPLVVPSFIVVLISTAFLYTEHSDTFNTDECAKLTEIIQNTHSNPLSVQQASTAKSMYCK